MKRVVIIATAIILTGVTAWLLIPLTNPNRLTSSISLARPNAIIRRDLLRITPIGTSMEEVIEVIEERNWRLSRITEDFGVFVDMRFGIISRGRPTEMRLALVMVGGLGEVATETQSRLTQ